MNGIKSIGGYFMSDQTIIIYTLSIMAAALVIAGIVVLCLVLRWKKTVLNTSEKIKLINNLNSITSFHMDIWEQYDYSTAVKSKSQFDRYNIDKGLVLYMISNKSFWESILSHITENRETLKRYDQTVQAIRNTSGQDNYYGVPQNIYEKKERNLFNKLIITPNTETMLVYTVTYTSPKGQNSYRRAWTFRTDELKDALAEANRVDQNHESNLYQRTLFSNSLRYDVLKRDGFRCQICGRTAQDGVKLHVDHIIPVSKGGKTEMGNLRTLCSDCNVGKKDKYDPNGLN